MKPEFDAFIVWLILNGKAEKALKLLAKHYNIDAPKIKVGLPKGHKKKTIGCYNAKKKTIFVLNSDTLKEPFIILHEFYHHLRTTPNTRHKGTERYADEFARKFIQTYTWTATRVQGNN